MNGENPSRQAALFLQLVLGLQQSAMMALGKLMNPITRKIERNLEAARDAIDTLAAIEARTEGKLEPDERRVLQQVLTELRMNYLDELKRSGQSVPGGDSD
jgi:tellurite resistance protein